MRARSGTWAPREGCVQAERRGVRRQRGHTDTPRPLTRPGAASALTYPARPASSSRPRPPSRAAASRHASPRRHWLPPAQRTSPIGWKRRGGVVSPIPAASAHWLEARRGPAPRRPLGGGGGGSCHVGKGGGSGRRGHTGDVGTHGRCGDTRRGRAP